MELPDFIIKPRQLIEDKDITSLDGDVYGLIYWYTKLKLERCILNNASFAKLLHVESRSIQRSLARLKEKGFIIIVYDDENSTSRSEIIPLINFGGTTVQSGGGDPTVVGVRPNGHHNKIDLIREINNNITGEAKLTGPVKENKKEFYGKIITYCLKVQDISQPFVNYVKQATAIKKIFTAGYSKEDLRFVIDEMARDPYWSENTFDLMNVANSMHKYLNRTVMFKKEVKKYANI